MCLSCKLYLSNLQNVYAKITISVEQITKCICPNLSASMEGYRVPVRLAKFGNCLKGWLRWETQDILKKTTKRKHIF